MESHNYEIECEDHISFIARNAVPKAVTLSEVESATATDPVLQAVISAMKSGCWHKAPPGVSLSELSRYEQVKELLTYTDTVLVKSDRLVVAAVLQERIVDIAHEGHMGIVISKIAVAGHGTRYLFRLTFSRIISIFAILLSQCLFAKRIEKKKLT